MDSASSWYGILLRVWVHACTCVWTILYYVCMCALFVVEGLLSWVFVLAPSCAQMYMLVGVLMCGCGCACVCVCVMCDV